VGGEREREEWGERERQRGSVDIECDRDDREKERGE
jgi:hypothetical protein